MKCTYASIQNDGNVYAALSRQAGQLLVDNIHGLLFCDFCDACYHSAFHGSDCADRKLVLLLRNVQLQHFPVSSHFALYGNLPDPELLHVPGQEKAIEISNEISDKKFQRTIRNFERKITLG